MHVLHVAIRKDHVIQSAVKETPPPSGMCKVHRQVRKCVRKSEAAIQQAPFITLRVYPLITFWAHRPLSSYARRQSLFRNHVIVSKESMYTGFALVAWRASRSAGRKVANRPSPATPLLARIAM